MEEKERKKTYISSSRQQLSKLGFGGLANGWLAVCPASHDSGFSFLGPRVGVDTKSLKAFHSASLDSYLPHCHDCKLARAFQNILVSYCDPLH